MTFPEVLYDSPFQVIYVIKSPDILVPPGHQPAPVLFTVDTRDHKRYDLQFYGSYHVLLVLVVCMEHLTKCSVTYKREPLFNS